MKYIKKYLLFNENKIWYKGESEILNDLKNSDIEDIVIPLLQKNLYVKMHYYNDSNRISIWYDDDDITKFSYSEIKDDVEFLVKYIEKMGYKTRISFYDVMSNSFKPISFAKDDMIDQLDINIEK